MCLEKKINAMEATQVCRDPEMTNLMAIFKPGPTDLQEFHQQHLIPSCLIKALPIPTTLLPLLDDNRTLRMP